MSYKTYWIVGRDTERTVVESEVPPELIRPEDGVVDGPYSDLEDAKTAVKRYLMSRKEDFTHAARQVKFIKKSIVMPLSMWLISRK